MPEPSSIPIPLHLDLVPLIQRLMARISEKDNLALIQNNEVLYGLSHLMANLCARRLRNVFISKPTSPSTDTHKGVKLA